VRDSDPQPIRTGSRILQARGRLLAAQAAASSHEWAWALRAFTRLPAVLGRSSVCQVREGLLWLSRRSSSAGQFSRHLPKAETVHPVLCSSLQDVVDTLHDAAAMRDAPHVTQKYTFVAPCLKSKLGNPLQNTAELLPPAANNNLDNSIARVENRGTLAPARKVATKSTVRVGRAVPALLIMTVLIPYCRSLLVRAHPIRPGSRASTTRPTATTYSRSSRTLLRA